MAVFVVCYMDGSLAVYLGVLFKKQIPNTHSILFFVLPESQLKVKSQKPTYICIFVNLEVAHYNGKETLTNRMGLLNLQMGKPGRPGDEVIWAGI